MANGMHAYSSSASAMAGGMPNSPAPFIKPEPQEDNGRFIPQQGFGHHPDAYSMSAGNGQFHQHGGFGEHRFSNGDAGIDPSELTMSPNMSVQQGGGFVQNYGSQFNNQGMSTYMNSGATVDDDDLLALGNLDEHQHQEQHHNPNHDQSSLYQLFPEMGQDPNKDQGGNGIPVGSNPDHVFSHTPENAPAGSPFIRGFQYAQLRTYNGATAETPSSYNASPIIGSNHSQGSNFDQYMATGKRKMRPGMERTNSRRSPHDGIPMSPHTPKTPALGALSLGTPESSSMPTQPIQTMGGHRHHKSLSSQWAGSPGSEVSYMQSPLSSPGQGPVVHPQISEVFKSGKHASLPTKVETGMGGSSNGAAFQTQEAKRRRRRESHNMVERRRRDNINERIQELSHLVPQHRLEDEKVRKHLINNGSLSPTVGGTSGSPPRATSMLAGGVGRRASGVPAISNEEKDKGPNKGDILNGAVGWTRDLMWSLHTRLQQEKEIRALVESLGGTYPFDTTEEDKRMASELQTAIEKNGVHNFRYSRAPGTNLRVPGYTDYAGQPVSGDSVISSPRVSPGAPKPNGSSSRGTPNQQQQPFIWNEGSSGITFKEEEELDDTDML